MAADAAPYPPCMAESPTGPPLPPGRHVKLRGRGTTFVREIAGPPGAETVVLLHGLGATADLNWFRCYGPLGRHYRVISLDHRGHGRGIRSMRPFRLSDCADDVAALAEHLDIDRIIPVGYSMGGPIAQLLWRRHRDLVGGLVLCATSRSFSRQRPTDRVLMSSLLGLSAAARVTPPQLRTYAVTLIGGQLGNDPMAQWAMRQIRRHDQSAVLQAAWAIGSYDSRRWTGEVDVPAAVVATMKDRNVPAWRQVKLAQAIPGATLHRIAADHGACAVETSLFNPALLEACRSVTSRLPSTVSHGSARS